MNPVNPDDVDNEVFISAAEAHGAKVFRLGTGATIIIHGGEEFLLPPKPRGRIFRVISYPPSTFHFVDENFLRIDEFTAELAAVTPEEP